MHRVRVKVTPAASKEKVIRVADDSYEIYVREPAQNGHATARVRVLIAREYKIAIQSVQLKTGAQSRSKMFVLEP